MAMKCAHEGVPSAMTGFGRTPRKAPGQGTGQDDLLLLATTLSLGNALPRA